MHVQQAEKLRNSTTARHLELISTAIHQPVPFTVLAIMISDDRQRTGDQWQSIPLSGVSDQAILRKDRLFVRNVGCQSGIPLLDPQADVNLESSAESAFSISNNLSECGIIREFMDYTRWL